MQNNYPGESCFSYYGGKQRLAPLIVPLLPPHTVYCEPFAGGAGVFFSKPWLNITAVADYREVLNDIDGNIINFYRVLQDVNLREKLIERLEVTPFAKAEYEYAKESLADETVTDLVTRAWSFFTAIMQSFNHSLGCSGWRRAVFGSNEGLKWLGKSTRLRQYIERMQGVALESLDAITCIDRWDSPQTVFYCDPPYPGTVQRGYAGKYSFEDFEKLCNRLETIQGSFLLSCYNTAPAPAQWEKFSFELPTASDPQGKVFNTDKSHKVEINAERAMRIECVYRKISQAATRPEIQEIYQKFTQQILF